MKTKDNTEFIQIRLPKEMKIKAEEASQKLGLTTSAYIKMLIHNDNN
jgi:antitoxin component of RelBE/YafQ-DinJ toxin-antitoxin module